MRFVSCGSRVIVGGFLSRMTSLLRQVVFIKGEPGSELFMIELGELEVRVGPTPKHATSNTRRATCSARRGNRAVCGRDRSRGRTNHPHFPRMPQAHAHSSVTALTRAKQIGRCRVTACV